LTKGGRAFAALAAAACLALSGPRISASPAQLGAEIQRFEQMLASSISAAERHYALARLARLRQLTGNIALAASHWLEAAAIDPADEFALVSGAYALAAIGEWERALAAIQPLLAPGRGGPAALQARYLNATLMAWVGSDISALAALAADPEAAVLRPAIYYTLWWTEARDPVSFGGNAEVWRRRLIEGYPRSPEARIAAAEDSRGADSMPAISAIHSPLWLLLPGMPVGEHVGIPEGSALAELAGSPAPLQGGPPHEAHFPAYGQQTGLFRSEANARRHAEALREAGFPAALLRRQIDGADHWAVVVPTQDSARTAHELRIAGHDSFRVRLGQ